MKPENTQTNETIDLTPTWVAAARIYLTVLKDGTEEGKREAAEGIFEMARKFDDYIARIELREKSEGSIIIKLANAMATAQQCSGHNKAARNESVALGFKEELKKMGAFIPADDVLYKIGLYNGEGSV